MDNVKKIVITGSMGFIFSHVTEYFLKKGYNVYGIDNLSEGSHPELIPEFKKYNDVIYKTKDNPVENVTPGRFTFIELDVARDIVIPTIKTINPDYIIHAAAISDVDYSIRNPIKTITQNNNATLNVFEAACECTNLKKLLYVSTDEVYGECDHPKTEEEILFPKNPYAASKAFGSLLRLTYDNTYSELKDKTVETRFCNVFGPRQDDRKIIPAIVRALNGGKPLELHNDGNGFRQYIYVSEIPPLVELLLEKGSRTYNITSGEGFKVWELVKMAREITGKDVPMIVGERKGMDIKYEMSFDRLTREFNWKPRRYFEEHFVEYLHENLN